MTATERIPLADRGRAMFDRALESNEQFEVPDDLGELIYLQLVLVTALTSRGRGHDHRDFLYEVFDGRWDADLATAGANPADMHRHAALLLLALSTAEDADRRRDLWYAADCPPEHVVAGLVQS